MCISYARNNLKLSCDWLKANRLSSNVDKSKLLMFNNDSISIKLGGVKHIPSDNVKYLGLHLHKYLSGHAKKLTL